MRAYVLSALIGASCATVAVAASTLLAPGAAQADQNPATDAVPRVVPYEGTLSNDGLPYEGSVALRFTLWDGADPVWSEDQPVAVSAGRFSVLLGRTTPLESVIAGADDLTIGVTILNGPGDADDVALVGRQRITPAPYALWTARGADLEVGGDLEVQRNLVVNGTTRVNGRLSFAARATSAWITFGDGLYPDTTFRSFECPVSEYVCGVEIDEFTGQDGDVRSLRVKCCTLGL